MSTSSVAGLGSSQITSELDTIEERLQAPITQLTDQITTDKAEISAFGTIQGAISSLSSSLSGIEDVSTINTRTAAGGGGVFTATAGSAAQKGTFNVNVNALASVQEIFSTTKATSSASAAAKLGSGSGTLTFNLKGGKTETVTVGSGSMTLNGIASAINKVAGGVQAGVVSTANGAELTLQSSATGSSQAFSVSGTGTLAKFDFSSANPPSANASAPVKLAQTASNASLTINGVPITSTSNKISSALTGVSLTLTAKGNSTLTIGSSINGISSAVGKVATDLNTAISTIAKQTLFVGSSNSASASASASAPKSGALAGNFTAEGISNQLLSAVSGAAASGMSSNSIGLTVSSKGAVALNAATFASAFAKNPTAVQTLLGKISSALGTVTKQALGTSTGTSGGTGNSVGEGTLTAQTDALQNTITSINSNISQMEKADTTQLDSVAAEFSAAESAASNASVTSLFLSIFTGSGSSSSS
jgi:flagellar hook-associated protein 2